MRRGAVWGVGLYVEVVASFMGVFLALGLLVMASGGAALRANTHPALFARTAPVHTRHTLLHALPCRPYAVLVGGANENGAERGMFTIVELIDHRVYKINLPISEVDLHCTLYERPSTYSRQSKSPFVPPTRTA